MSDLPLADRDDIVLPEPPDAARQALAAAQERDYERAAVAEVVANFPTFLGGWAALAADGRDPIERYAYARVGYHRGLDALRQAGWGGVNYVRWAHPSNRGFLACLVRLRDAAVEIGERDEVARIDGFVRELDPDWDDVGVRAALGALPAL